MSFFNSSKKAKQKSEIERLTQERESLLRSEAENKQKLSELEERANDFRTSVERLSIENKELKNKLQTEEPYEKIFNERQDLLEESSNKTITIKQLESENKKMAETIETMQKDQERDGREREELTKEIETHKQKLAELEAEREELDNRIDDLEKRNSEFEDEMIKLKEEIDKIKTDKEKVTNENEKITAENEELNKKLQEGQENEAKQNRQYIEDLRKELAESKIKIEGMMLESEALKSENESLFRANDAKKEEINEIQKEVTSIKTELQLERLRYKKLKDEWEQEKKRTEFVLVSKSGKKRQKHALETFKEENDSEDEHVLGVVEAAKAEKETLLEKEKELKRRINQLQIDKEELFRSGTNLFSENKSLKAKYDQTVNERTMLLQVEAALKRKVRGQEEEIKELKKTIDDLYYQNMAIRTNEENENKKSSYVVVMGNEMIKQLEREKSALYRRVKFLEKENNEIESRVIELERQSADLVNYSKTHSDFPETRRSRDYSYRDRPKSRDHSREPSLDRHSNRGSDRGKRSERFPEYRPPSGKVSYHEYREKHHHPTTLLPTKSPDYYKSNAPPFASPPARQLSIGHASVRSHQSHGSRISLPPVGSRAQSPGTILDQRRVTPLTTRR